MPYIPGVTGPNLLKSATEAVDWDKIERDEREDKLINKKERKEKCLTLLRKIKGVFSSKQTEE